MRTRVIFLLKHGAHSDPSVGRFRFVHMFEIVPMHASNVCLLYRIWYIHLKHMAVLSLPKLSCYNAHYYDSFSTEK